MTEIVVPSSLSPALSFTVETIEQRPAKLWIAGDEDPNREGVTYYYRYEGQAYENGEIAVKCWAFPVVRETDRTVLIDAYEPKPKRLVKGAERSWAYADKMSALKAFYHRKRYQEDILAWRRREAEILRDLAQEMIAKNALSYNDLLSVNSENPANDRPDDRPPS